MSITLIKDIAERVAWTAAQGAVGVLTVEMFDAPVAYAALIAAGLAFLKGVIASKVGYPDSASTVPSV